MDVTFTNVLEGARQYFQGLPTASCSTASTSYTAGGEHQSGHYGVEQNQERTSSASSSYWPPPHQEPQVRPQTRDPLQRPPSHQSDTSRPSPLSQQPVTQLPEQLRTSSTYHAQDSSRSTSHNQTSSTYHTQTPLQEQAVPTSASHSFQFTRPHSREVQQQHVSQQQQYQSHILPNPSYLQSSTPQQNQNRVPPRIQESQTYHQMQPQNHTQQTHAYANYQQSRPYYPVHSQSQQQSQSYHHSYQIASGQAYSQPQESSYIHHSYPSHSQNSYSTDNTYVTSKAATPHNQDLNVAKENQSNLSTAAQQNTQNTQPYRTTHNLPPIAALSTLNYHSSRSSREVMRIANSKTRTSVSATPTTSSYSTKPVTDTSRVSMQYSLHNNHNDYTNGIQQNRVSVSQPYHYPTTTTTQSNNHYASSSVSTATAPPSQHQSTNIHSNYQPQPVYANPESAKTYQPSNSKVVQQQQQQPQPQHQQQTSATQSVTNISNSNNTVTSVMKQKRESPLDLSVKTVRTSADSTLDDVDMHANDVQRMSKYYQTGRPTTYPTCDIYANSFQRNLATKTAQFPSSSGAPKVDFLPNFNVSSLTQTPGNRRATGQSPYDNATQKQFYDRKNVYQQRSTTTVNSVPTSAHSNSSSVLQSSIKKPLHGLPRIDFLPPTHKTSTMYAVPSSNDSQRKRTTDQVPAIVPNKIQKVDMWRQTIDQQIEQRLSSYAKSRMQQEQVQKQGVPNKLVNGNYGAGNKDLYSSTYHRPQYNAAQTPHTYTTSTNHYNNIQTSHSQTYVPTPAAHQYPGYTNHGSQQQQQQQTPYPEHSLSRTNSNPSLPVVGANRNNLGGAADRRVLSLLRNSLEIKGAKEAQKKMEQVQHPRSDIQQPSTDVMAPLQPKPGVVGRHNMSPFAATSLFERNSNTPPTYKFHLPKAIDSIKFDGEMPKDTRTAAERIISKQLETNHATISNSNTDLDGLAAFLAARIRTKAELKQVGPTQNVNLIRSSSESQLLRPTKQNAVEYTAMQGSPPKLTKEKLGYPPRRRLFSRTEDDPNGTVISSNVPPRDKSGLRSSSETSVFDFPDSDSETEMPVLERQSLLDMRRDRKTYPKSGASSDGNSTGTATPQDASFDDVCDKFMEQLKTGVGKKRGRRKKVEADVIAKLETVVTRERPLGVVVVKEEPVNNVTVKVEKPSEEETTVPLPKGESDSDSDVPLIQCKSKPNVTESPVDCEKPTAVIKTEKEEEEKKLGLSSDSESDSETIKNISEKLKVKQEKDGGDKKSESPANNQTKQNSGFGDGSEFHPGWEEEVYRYKRSLRMPAGLIHVTRPPHWHRLSTSLPDLDPCPNSPSPSEHIESNKTKIKSEPLDSDVDSNSNFSFSLAKNNYDSEEGGNSSVKNVPSNTKPKSTNSILDRLLERCGARKRRKQKKKEEIATTKIIPKSEKLELLPTPGVGIDTLLNKGGQSSTKDESSSLLAFRKKTIENFKDTLINSSNSLLSINEQFKTVVFKSRTRMETRVMKQKATIKEIFGEDRPASAPPVTCVDNSGTQFGEDIDNKAELNLSFTKEDNANSVLENTKEVLKNKLLNRGKKDNLLKTLTAKKIISEYSEDVIKRDPDSKSETPSIDGDDYNIPARKRMKNIRRKFSSGFDYIRKKKKQVKKEGAEPEAIPKTKRRGLLPKTSPESVQDIQKEIKMWVMNKGIGETHLHRAARLGYTDITAYCLEKMECSPSPKDNAGYTPLHEACARGHLSIAKLLLLYGANVSESAQGGIRPLHEAAENGFVEIVRLLLSFGADPMLATYSGLTPLSLATDESTIALLQNHIADMQGQPSALWFFKGPASCFEPEESGYNPLEDVPNADPVSEDEDVEFEESDVLLPNLYTIRGEPQTDKWILLQDLSNILKIKSRDALLRQINPVVPSTSTSTSHKSVLRELKMADFLEQASCCQYMCAGEKVNTRASKIALVKYTDKVRQLLGVEKNVVTSR